MPYLTDLESKLAELEKEILLQGPKIAAEIAVNALALAKNRIQSESGIVGKQYSTKPMLATLSMFNRKAGFEPTEIGSELGRDEFGKLIKGGKRNKKGEIAKKKNAKKRFLWLKFPKAKKAVPVMILPGGYKELRKLNGLQTSKVDLTFSGRMFQNLKLLEPRNSGAKFLAVIGAKDKENKDKLSGNFIRYGDFLAPTNDETEVLQTVQLNRLRSIFQKVLG
jgi:hypothetical protein